ncbi:MAG: hypothetical protein Q7K54_00150 [Candidatus Parcubacteria bacterium]|nr:hypothetical protein [Candidatus Parcubacteria bacterium]
MLNFLALILMYLAIVVRAIFQSVVDVFDAVYMPFTVNGRKTIAYFLEEFKEDYKKEKERRGC